MGSVTPPTTPSQSISGLGPHGERASDPRRLVITASDAAAARDGGYRVAVVLHTLSGNWSEQHLAAIAGTLGDVSISLLEAVDCQFNPDRQIAALDRLIDLRPDAIISLPVENTAVAAAHRRVAEAGIKLLLLDNAPTGLLPGKDYVSLVSADNFGLGRTGAELLAPHLPQNASVGVLTYGVDFFATNQREIAFSKWMGGQRPDVTLKTAAFPAPHLAGGTAESFLSTTPDLDGLFVVWDEPAVQVLETMERLGVSMPVTTVDLGEKMVPRLADGTVLKGVAAQNPYSQGLAMAQVAILALLGRQTPAWIALPGLPITSSSILGGYQSVWRAPAPAEIVEMTAR
ncbi:substrate-binding domain-containing protein [Nioella nitratireducens]|uniref:substrate-binding domain-containing protein n=1 Tax=Nioella nitratireducens TaxID=1287720 RepID=UPI0008FD6C92|nr:substrate-binding domain-containing protein [Nioella nitratireducens]